MTDKDRQHKWIWRRMGGSPAEVESYEYVRYCEVCGMEDTCEDQLPPCERDDESTDAARMLNGETKR